MHDQSASQPVGAGLPGRTCPLRYRYSPRVFRQPPVFAADTLYLIGGLYGNTEALHTVLQMQRAEARRGRPVQLMFNGDFNWFNVDPDSFHLVNRTVLQQHAIQGNVEAELAAPHGGTGCGCAYPPEVDAATVARSNQIMRRLQQTALGAPEVNAQLSALPMYSRVQVGDQRIAIAHGDPESLAGWGFAASRLRDAQTAGLANYFRQADVDAFCTTHTCLPAMRALQIDGRVRVIANNGAAGMPNFPGTGYGLLTRISVHDEVPGDSLYGTELGSGRIDAIPIRYDSAAWLRRFVGNWPPGSAAHASYYRRLVDGPVHGLAQAVLDGIRRS